MLTLNALYLLIFWVFCDVSIDAALAFASHLQMNVYSCYHCTTVCFPVQQKIQNIPNVGPPKLRSSTLYVCCQTIKINLIGMSLLGLKSEHVHMGS